MVPTLCGDIFPGIAQASRHRPDQTGRIFMRLHRACHAPAQAPCSIALAVLAVVQFS